MNRSDRRRSSDSLDSDVAITRLASAGLHKCQIHGCDGYAREFAYCEPCRRQLKALDELYALKQERQLARAARNMRAAQRWHALCKRHARGINRFFWVAVILSYWYAVWSGAWQLMFGGK